MESINEKYIQALCALHEDDFTKRILKPLFESMGFERVDFNGGSYERGRDLIAQRRIPPRKEMYVVYVQSKKIGNIQNTSLAAKLSTLIHQLRQCCTVKITDSEGNKILPNEVYLACPEPISNRLIEELETQLFDMPIKVLTYDGPQIIANINEFKPDLLELLTDIEDKLYSNKLAPSNKELLSALKSNNDACLNDFYSDLSFFVGLIDSNLLLHLRIDFKEDKLNIAEESWFLFKEELEKLSKKHKFQLIDEKVNVVEERFIKNKKEYESKLNQELKKKFNQLDEKKNDISVRIDGHLKALIESINPYFNNSIKRLSSDQLLEREDIISYLKSVHSSKEKVKLENFKIEKCSFASDANFILSLIKKNHTLQVEQLKIQENIIGKPFYKIKINTQVLTDKIEQYKNTYLKDIHVINKREISISRLSKFLHETERTLSLVSRLKCESFVLSQIITFSLDKNLEDGVSISPHDIFSTGRDIAVYGGAGVGKTTTLKAYADIISSDDNSNLIYIPLNRLVDEFKKILINITDDNNYLKKDLLIKIILLSKGINPSGENIESSRKILSNHLVLILDGLDEIYNTIPEIIAAISQFKTIHPNSQLIISSRDCVSFLSNIDFLGITLLPFTKEQLNKFIRGWFSKSEKADKLIESIRSRDLFEHVKTPLLATITCSLVEKGINAPSTEHEIYSERLRLLTGEYDLHKNIERQKQKGELLRKCAIKIAYRMHDKSLRSLAKNEILKTLYNSLSEYYKKELLTDCLEDLINPCSVLIFDPVTSTYSFGHFRFQEHLVSEELKTNRSIDLSELVTNDWWRGVLGLYSQENDISYLIEDTYKRYGNLTRAAITLEAMIQNSPHDKRKGLKELLKNYLITDKSDAPFFDEDVYDDFYSYDPYRYN